MAGRASQLLDQARTTLRDAPVELPGEYRLLREDQLEPNTWNPNRQDDETFLKEKTSIRRFGFVVPIIVRPHPKTKGRWQIIDGEHRLKAGLELEMTAFPCYDIGPVSDHEAMQLTILLNELKGKPEEKKLGEVLKRLLASDTLDRLTEVMPYSKEQYSKLAKLPGFDWDAMRERNEQRSAERAEKRWVERVFRMPKEGSAALTVALEKVKQGEDMSDGEALAALAQDWLGSDADEG